VKRGTEAALRTERLKLNGIDPQACLRHVLTHIADHQLNRVAELLPWNVAERFTRKPD
jgi:hypothetical protein